MSLNAAAQHLAAHGRGPDNTLVHMSRGEVKGLQDLAMAHGGSLSINPQTGLPEAGFLSSLLPMIGGAALSAMGMPPMMASLVMGGITGVKSGSLSKGLMAGLGAYGGAGLMGGLTGAGADIAAQSAYGAGAGATDAAAQAAGFGSAEEMAQIQAAKAMQAAKTASPFSTAFEGAKGLGSEAGRSSFMSNIGGGKELLKYGAAAAVPVLSAPSTTTKQPEIQKDTDPGKMAREGYQFDPGYVDTAYDSNPFGPERTYAKPRYYRPGYAGGGPVEEMSNANAIGANTGYPMADINKGAYATPYQQPISRNVLSGVSDTGINPMTGEMRFDEGGIVPSTTGQGGKFEYDPLNYMFKQIESMPSDSQEQPAQPAQMGGGYTANQGNQTPGTSALPSSMVSGGGNITPMAYPSLALSKMGDAALTGIGLIANKFSKPNPNPNAVQVSDAGDMLNSPSALADSQAMANAHNAQQAQAIATALAGLHGVGPAGAATTGTTSSGGAPGAPALGINSGGGYAFGTPATTTGAGFGAGGGGGGVGVSTGSGSGGGATAMGAAGMSGTASAAAGAARGGLMAAYANGGSHLGDYSDGGRLLKGPGDGVSDSIPAMIGRKQPARLADGEFVVPARIVSELGNGSTEAGARKLYAMMDRVQKARGKTVGKGRVAKNSRAERFLPA